MKKLLLIITLVYLCFIASQSWASTKWLDYGWEDWTGDAETTPEYIISSTDSGYWAEHLADSEVVTSYDPSGAEANLTPHSGSYFLLRNDSPGYSLNPSVDGITTGNVNDHFNIGLEGAYGGGYAFDLDDISAGHDGYTGEFYIQFWAALNGNWYGLGDRGECKWVRWYTGGSSTDNVHFELKGDGKVRIITYGPGHGIIEATSSSAIVIDDWLWHKYAMLIRIDVDGETDEIYVWVGEEANDDFTPTLDNYTVKLSGAIYNDDIDTTVVIQGNFSANNPESLLFHALDDIQIWDGLPNAFPTITVTASDGSASEDGDTGTYTVSCSPDCDGETINFNFSAGTAVLDTDFNCDHESSITITGSSDTVTLTPVDDGSIEEDETAILTLTSGSGYTVGSPSSATINISDNDGACISVGLSSGGITIGE